VLGMHRSGTSLLTRLVTLLGIELCRQEDLLVGGARNPRGHWESVSLIRYNDRLLEELGCTWFCPPPMDAGETSKLLERHRTEALDAVQHAHPNRPWVWKDPRTCALMPFWAPVLGERVVYLLVARHPLEVRDSLSSRNGFAPALSMAMWERYTRQAMLGAAGRPAIQCTYDGVLADPVAWCEQLAGFLAEAGIPTRGVDHKAVEAFATSELRHSSQSWSALQPGAEISAEQVELARAASVPTAQLVYSPPPLPGESPQATAILQEVFETKPKPGGLAALPAHLRTPRDTSGQSREDSSPPVSVVIAGGDADAVRSTLAAFGDSLPAGSELLFPAGAGEGAAAGRDLVVRELDGDGPLGEAAALALGARSAQGRLVLLTSGPLTSIQPWHEPLGQILAGRRGGGAGTAMRFEPDPARRWLGRAFADERLLARPLAGWADDRPVPVPLLPSALSAYTRRVLAAAGGVDGEFAAAAAAIDELSIRLWRMGFRCIVAAQVEAHAPAPDSQDAHEALARLHDRMRIATLHFGPERLESFLESARREPGFDEAAARLAASDTERRRAAIEAVCGRSIDWYLESFPPGRTGPVELPGAGRRLGTVARIRRRLRRR